MSKKMDLLDQVLQENGLITSEDNDYITESVFMEGEEKVEEAMHELLKSQIFESEYDDSKKVQLLESAQEVQFTDEQKQYFIENYLDPVIQMSGALNVPEGMEMHFVPGVVYETAIALEMAKRKEFSSISELIQVTTSCKKMLTENVEEFDLSDIVEEEDEDEGLTESQKTSKLLRLIFEDYQVVDKDDQRYILESVKDIINTVPIESLCYDLDQLSEAVTLYEAPVAKIINGVLNVFKNGKWVPKSEIVNKYDITSALSKDFGKYKGKDFGVAGGVKNAAVTAAKNTKEMASTAFAAAKAKGGELLSKAEEKLGSLSKYIKEKGYDLAGGKAGRAKIEELKKTSIQPLYDVPKAEAALDKKVKDRLTAAGGAVLGTGAVAGTAALASGGKKEEPVVVPVAAPVVAPVEEPGMLQKAGSYLLDKGKAVRAQIATVAPKIAAGLTKRNVGIALGAAALGGIVAWAWNKFRNPKKVVETLRAKKETCGEDAACKAKFEAKIKEWQAKIKPATA